MRPVLGQHALTEFVLFTESDSFKSPSPFKTEGETTYATEQIKHPQFHSSSPSSFTTGASQ